MNFLPDSKTTKKVGDFIPDFEPECNTRRVYLFTWLTENDLQSCFYSVSFDLKYFSSCIIQKGFSLDLIHQVKKIIACNRRCTRFSDVRRLVQCLVLTYICWINGRDTFIFHVSKKNERNNWKSCNKNQARTIWDNNLFELYILGFTRFLVCCPRRSSKIHFYSLIFFGSVLKNLPH